MYTKYKKYLNVALLFAFLCLVSASVLLNSCKKDDNDEDNTIVLLSYGPMPIARGAELRFIGRNLHLVTSVVLPGDIEITEFGMKTPEKITITVPQNAVPGYLVLKTPQGDIQPMTAMDFSEPLSIDNSSPDPVKPGSVLTITGDYLNLVGQVIFTDNVAVDSTDFVSQSRYELSLPVPAAAQTGLIAISNGAEDPIIVYSDDTLNVVLPVITSFSPNPVKAGTSLTINGTDLDLVNNIVFGGNRPDTGFISQSETQIVVSVPVNTQDESPFKLIPSSMVEVLSNTLDLIIPVVTSVTPNPARPGVGDITVVGTDLDLIDNVVFGGNAGGAIQAGGTSTTITVSVPSTAVDGVVAFNTQSGTFVNSPATLTMVDQTITGITPDDPEGALTGTTVTIAGTNLDIIAQAFFEGDVEGEIQSGGTQTSLQVKVPAGVQEGLRTIRLVASNGTEVTSTMKVDIEHRNPTITSMSPLASEGALFVIEGTDLDVIVSTTFYNGKLATRYGTKSDTRLEVYVPAGITKGPISFVNIDGDVIITDTVNVPGAEPIADPALVIFDFEQNEAGHNLGWDNWSSMNEAYSTEPLAFSGVCLHAVNTAANADGWLWGCNHLTFPSLVNAADYYLKIDVNITTPIVGSAAVSFVVSGNWTAPDLVLGINQGGNTYSTPGWMTQTWDLSALGLTGELDNTGDYGLFFRANGLTTDLTGLYIDNIRFEHK